MERRNIERWNMKRRRGNELKARITRNRKQRDENLNRKKILKNRAHFTAMISIKVIRTGLQVWKKSVENSSWTNVRAQLAQKNCPFESIIHWRNPQRRISHFGQNYCHFFGAASSARSKSWKRRQMAQNRTTFTLSWAPHLQWYRWTYGDNLKGAKSMLCVFKGEIKKKRGRRCY